MYVNVTKLSQVTRGITPRLSSGRFPELLKFRLNLAILVCMLYLVISETAIVIEE